MCPFLKRKGLSYKQQIDRMIIEARKIRKETLKEKYNSIDKKIYASNNEGVKGVIGGDIKNGDINLGKIGSANLFIDAIKNYSLRNKIRMI